MVTYLAQLLSGWKCNCFVNACNCCNCLLVPLLEFGVTSPALSGTRWAVPAVAILCNQTVASVLPHLPPTTVLAASIQILCDNTCAQKPSQSLLKKQKQNKTKKWDCLYLYQLPGAHTENWRNSHPKHVNETHIQLRQAGWRDRHGR